MIEMSVVTLIVLLGAAALFGIAFVCIVSGFIEKFF